MNIEEMKTNISTWAKRELDLVRQSQTLAAAAAAAVLDSEPNQDPASDSRRTRALAELRGAEEAIQVARRRRLQSLQAKRTTEIQSLRDRRADLEKENAALSAEIERHRRELAELLGVQVVITTAAGMYSRLHTVGHKIGGVNDHIRRLEKPLPDSGVLDVQDASSIGPLIDALAAFEGAIPPMESLLEWAAAVEPAPGETFRDLPRTFHLVWANDVIDYQQSSIFVGSLCSPGPIGIISNRPVGINIASGTFRAPAVVRRP